MEDMKKVCVVSCPISTRSGYGARSRDFVRALIQAKPDWDVKILSQRWGNTPMDALTAGIDDDLLKRIIVERQTQKPNVWIQITVPNEFQPIGDYNIGVTAGVETTIMPPDCIEGINRMDKVLVSSNFTKGVIENTIFDKRDQKTNQVVGTLKCEKPIEVLFEGYNVDVYDSELPSELVVDELLSDVNESFAFLFVGHWLQGDFKQDRKNVGGLIWTFLNTFKDKSKQPALILKVSGGSTSLTDRVRIKKKIELIKEQVKANRLPPIYLIHGDLTDAEMNALYNHSKVKAHVTFTHGEGFGRPLLEAATSGKPIIAPNWSGHLDFLNSEFATLVQGNLVNVHESAANQFLMKESQWFEIDYNTAGGIMQYMYEKYKQYAIKGRRLKQYVKKNFTYEMMIDLLKSQLDSVNDKPQTVGLKLPTLKKKELTQLQLPKLKKV